MSGILSQSNHIFPILNIFSQSGLKKAKHFTKAANAIRYKNTVDIEIIMIIISCIIVVSGGIMEMMFSNFWPAEKSPENCLPSLHITANSQEHDHHHFSRYIKVEFVSESAEAGFIWDQGHPQQIHHRHHYPRYHHHHHLDS